MFTYTVPNCKRCKKTRLIQGYQCPTKSCGLVTEVEPGIEYINEVCKNCNGFGHDDPLGRGGFDYQNPCIACGRRGYFSRKCVPSETPAYCILEITTKDKTISVEPDVLKTYGKNVGYKALANTPTNTWYSGVSMELTITTTAHLAVDIVQDSDVENWSIILGSTNNNHFIHLTGFDQEKAETIKARIYDLQPPEILWYKGRGRRGKKTRKRRKKKEKEPALDVSRS